MFLQADRESAKHAVFMKASIWIIIEVPYNACQLAADIYCVLSSFRKKLSHKGLMQDIALMDDRLDLCFVLSWLEQSSTNVYFKSPEEWCLHFVATVNWALWKKQSQLWVYTV